MDEFINDLDKKISKAQNITGSLFNDLRDIRISFNRLKEAINYSQGCKSDSEQLVCDCAMPFIEIEDTNQICKKCLKENNHTN